MWDGLINDDENHRCSPRSLNVAGGRRDWSVRFRHPQLNDCVQPHIYFHSLQRFITVFMII